MFDFWFIIEIIIFYTVVLFFTLWNYAKFENKKLAILIFSGFLLSTLFIFIIYKVSNFFTNSNYIVFSIIVIYIVLMIIYQLVFRKYRK